MALTPSRDDGAELRHGHDHVCLRRSGARAQRRRDRWRNRSKNLVKLPLGSKLYLRVNWKDVQQRPGRLDLCEHWKLTFDLARRYQKRIGLRVMMSNPDIPDSPLPEFLRDKIPMVKLGDWQKRTRLRAAI